MDKNDKAASKNWKPATRAVRGGLDRSALARFPKRCI